MSDRVKEPRVGDVWVAKDGYPRTIYDPEYADEGMPDTVEKQVATLITLGYIPAIVLPLDIAMQIQAEYSAKLLSAEIDGITDYSRGVRRIVDALETATGEKVEVVV